MCMIAYRPTTGGRGPNIPNAVIDTAMNRHPDGFGIAWREGGELLSIRYGPTSRKPFRKMLKRIDRNGFEYVAHFRWATHGPKAQSHSHPYSYEDPELGGVLVFHNGVISIGTTPQESDTEVFVRDILAKLGGRWWTNPALVYLVNEAIGWSKLVIMTNDETVNLNEDRGKWDGGIWYSSDHKPSKPTVWKPADNASVWTPYQEAQRKSAAESARILGLTVSDDPLYRDDGGNVLSLVPYAGNAAIRDVDRYAGLRHGGHSVSDIKGIRTTIGDADFEDGVVCDVCGTMGDAYVIDGVVYIDMAHKSDDSGREEEGGTVYTQASDLLPVH